jgi:N-acetylmuramoyl-L-alanine amidase
MLSDWSTNKTAEFTPSTPGMYRFVVYVKYKTKVGDVEDDYMAIDKIVEVPNSKLNSFSVTGDYKVNSKLTIKATATPENETLYKIWVCNRSDEKWIVLSDYSTNNVIEYTPTTQGLYTFVVYAKHISKSGDVYDTYLAQDKIIGGTKLIVIDPGHGGTDPGAVGSIYKEKDLNLELALKLKASLINKGYVVLMTRTSDVTVALKDRPALANSYGADLLISLHHNSAGYKEDGSFNTAPNGVEVLYTDNTSNVDKSRKIATEMSANIASDIGIYNRGGKEQDLCVCREAKMPAILVEAGFLTNPTEESYVAWNKTQEKIANSIANTILKYIY